MKVPFNHLVVFGISQELKIKEHQGDYIDYNPKADAI